MPVGRLPYIARQVRQERDGVREGYPVAVFIYLGDSKIRAGDKTPCVVSFLHCVRQSDCVTGEMLPTSEWL